MELCRCYLSFVQRRSENLNRNSSVARGNSTTGRFRDRKKIETQRRTRHREHRDREKIETERRSRQREDRDREMIETSLYQVIDCVTEAELERERRTNQSQQSLADIRDKKSYAGRLTS